MWNAAAVVPTASNPPIAVLKPSVPLASFVMILIFD
jgi:hypothetical protein